MPSLNDTPSANRTHIAFFGLRNAGKSTLVNAITGQEIAIVSDVAGTTTDPVSKAMEILPLGACMITDTAGLDDVGALGDERVRRTLDVLDKTDVAVWVDGDDDASQSTSHYARFRETCEKRNVPVLVYKRDESVDDLKKRIAAIKLADAPRPLVSDVVKRGDVVVCVCPIDESAPKGRLILPQQQVIRELIDSGAVALVCQPGELKDIFKSNLPIRMVITDSQAFGEVSKVVPGGVALTSFSIIFAKAKGDLEAYFAGVEAMRKLKDGDKVLIAEGCTHHRQCNDIGTVKLPKAVQKFSGAKLEFEFASGNAFPDELSRFALVIQCGGCMLTRRMVQSRIERCKAAGVPITNYGVALAAVNSIICH